MRYVDSTRTEIIHSTQLGLLAVGLALALTGAAVPAALGQMDFCEPYQFVGDAVWEIVPELAASGEEGRVAVVVDDGLYDSVSWEIAEFADDLAQEGYGVVVARFNGPAYDPGEPRGLRNRLQGLYAEHDSLVGAVLVGDLPHVCYERVTPVGGGVLDEAWPAEAFFMDMDGIWVDEYADDGWDAGKFDGWQDVDKQVEIWVSRVIGHNLPMMGASEEAIVNAYFSDSRSLRWEALRASHPALVAVGSDQHASHCSSGITTVGRAFNAADNVCQAEVIADAYLDALSLPWFDNYYYVYELGHGGFQSHTFNRDDSAEYVYGADYLARDPYVLGYSLMSCDTCNFTQDDFIGGIVAFNPAADALVVQGYSAMAYFAVGEQTPVLWREVGVGRSYGDAYKAEFNRWYTIDNLMMVLLGDGSLKAPSITWDSGGYYDNWSDALNWDPDGLPQQYDPVRISAATVEMDLATGDYRVWSVDLRDGANLTFSGGAENTLYVTSSLLAKPADPQSAITMNPGSRLDVERGDLANVTVNMPGSAYETTILNVAGTIEDCASVQIGPNSNVNAGKIEQGEIVVASDATLSTGQASDCVIDVASNGQLTADIILNSCIDVEANGSVTAGSRIENCAVAVGPNANVVTNRIRGSAAGVCDPGWMVTEGFVIAYEGLSEIRDPWTMSGGSAWFDRVTLDFQESVRIELAAGASLEVLRLPPPVRPEQPHEPCPDGPAHQLVFGEGDNEFAGGTSGDEEADEMYFGDLTVIKPAEEASTPHLTLRLQCELHIASDFEEATVYDSWDTRAVDIEAPPVFSETPDTEQAIELITPAFAVWYADPFAFLDVPCHGAFRDLSIPESSGPAVPIPVAMRNNYANSDLGWPTARGLYRNVTIGANRILEFRSAEGLIHFHGQALVDAAATVKLNGLVVDWDQVIIEVPGTIFGDWNGDCQITNNELAELQTVIAQGPYDPLMDCDCDGEINNTELSKFMINMAQQPQCLRGLLGGEGAGGDFGEEWPLMEGEPLYDWPLFDEWVPYEDVPDLAAWVAEQLSPEELAATIEALTATAVEFAGTPAGYDIAELLSYLE